MSLYERINFVVVDIDDNNVSLYVIVKQTSAHLFYSHYCEKNSNISNVNKRYHGEI